MSESERKRFKLEKRQEMAMAMAICNRLLYSMFVVWIKWIGIEDVCEEKPKTEERQSKRF